MKKSAVVIITIEETRWKIRTAETQVDGYMQLTTKKESEGKMSHFDYRISQCRICRLEYTSMCLKAASGVVIHICPICLEKAEDYFIWLCLNCGRPYFRLKNLVMNRMHGYGLKEARFLYETPLIQGIDFCVICNPEFIVELVYTNKEHHCSRT